MKEKININIIEELKNIIRTESKGLDILIKKININYEKAVMHLFHCKGNIVFIGVGKSGQIAKKLVSTLASIGTSSIFVHPTDAIHGDLGIIKPGDVVVALSKSGESLEVNSLLFFIKKIDVKIISITGNSNSTMADISDIILDFGDLVEACPFNIVPTTSTTVMLALGDSLAIILMKMKDVNKEKFANFHPGGRIGKRLLLRVSDVMLKGKNNSVIDISATIKDMLIEITSKQSGAVSVVDNHNKLIGLITDFDIRQVLNSGDEFMSTDINELMNKDPLCVNENDKAFSAFQLMQGTKKNHIVLPVINDKRIAVGMLRLIDIVKAGL
jgi:arabinose-5-phosphate isomerase